MPSRKREQRNAIPEYQFVKIEIQLREAEIKLLYHRSSTLKFIRV
ncbi:hypothetical protein [Bartonella choladocola]|nr:hypothetical protein [Bartonella choladocola]